MTRNCCPKQLRGLSTYVWKGYVHCTFCDALLEPAPKPKPEKPTKRHLGIA